MTEKEIKCDVVVIGAGHAGVEAATASARVGARTVLVTKKLGNFGEMSCNPAIGGVAKGTIVREIDALDGVMGRAIDLAGIHFRILNESKGAAVHSPRAQADRVLYREAVKRILREDYGVDFGGGESGGAQDGGGKNPDGFLDDAPGCHGRERSCNDGGDQGACGGLEVVFGSVVDILVEDAAVKGVVLEGGERILARSVVLTAGTFLNGVIHVGDRQIKAGRVGEEPSTGISERLSEFDFRLSRLKTGTPPRILKDSIDFSALEEQKGDAVPTPFSYLNDEVSAPQTSCFITYTNEKTHEVIRGNLEKSAMYGGQIGSKGPRYCPSIEDKVSRFAEKDRHQIFLEPEGLDLEGGCFLPHAAKNRNDFGGGGQKVTEVAFRGGEGKLMDVAENKSERFAPCWAKNKIEYQPHELIYPNGISTSLPAEVQEEFLRTIRGLESCVVAQAGYAIEYDFVDPRELLPTLETKKVRGLFFAGQINGTTGYEEAGGQGVVAGVNAGLRGLENVTKEARVPLLGEGDVGAIHELPARGDGGAGGICELPQYRASTRSAPVEGEFVLDRASSYIGVMIDDLTTLGVVEPYRMLTSRSEYRLSLRSDNADLRLTELGIAVGCVGERRREVFLAKKAELEGAREVLGALKISPKKLLEKGVQMKQDGVVRNGFELLSFPKINNGRDLSILREIFGEEIDKIAPKIQKQIAIEGLYAPYLRRQEQDVEVLRRDSALKIPLDIDYEQIKGLSAEVREKLNEVRPENVGSALRIQGVTPAAVMAVVVWLKKNS